MKAKKQANKQIHGLLFLFENGDFFFGLAYCPHVSGENGYQKSIFSKTLYSVEMFKRLAVLVWKDKTKVVENDYVMELDTSKCACSHQRWYRLQLHVGVDGQNQFKNTTCGRRFFGKRRKKISKFKQNRIRKVGALTHWHKNFLTNEMIFIFCIEYPLIPKISLGAYIFQRSFLMGLHTEGNLRFKIG